MKSVAVMDIINNQTTPNWIHHATLPRSHPRLRFSDIANRVVQSSTAPRAQSSFVSHTNMAKVLLYYIPLRLRLVSTFLTFNAFQMDTGDELCGINKDMTIDRIEVFLTIPSVWGVWVLYIMYSETRCRIVCRCVYRHSPLTNLRRSVLCLIK